MPMCSTKLTNPPYSPEIFAQLTIINFTVTMDGLEQQLLSRVVQMERPELEEHGKVRREKAFCEAQEVDPRFHTHSSYTLPFELSYDPHIVFVEDSTATACFPPSA
jgi:hypothetical protein